MGGRRDDPITDVILELNRRGPATVELVVETGVDPVTPRLSGRNEGTSAESGGHPRRLELLARRSLRVSVISGSTMVTPSELTDGLVQLRVLGVSDEEAWKAGEDIEQIRWFEAPGPAPMANIVGAINNWRSEWEQSGSLRHFEIWTGDVEHAVQSRRTDFPTDA